MADEKASALLCSSANVRRALVLNLYLAYAGDLLVLQALNKSTRPRLGDYVYRVSPGVDQFLSNRGTSTEILERF